MVRDLVCGLELGSCGIAVVGAWVLRSLGLCWFVAN